MTPENPKPTEDSVSIPPLPLRILRCLLNWKTWKECRILDAAACIVQKDEGWTGDLWIQIKARSDARWNKILNPTSNKCPEDPR